MRVGVCACLSVRARARARACLRACVCGLWDGVCVNIFKLLNGVC